MNTTIENAGAKSEAFRNSRLLIVMSFLASVVGFLVAPCLAILGLTTLFPLRGYTLDRMVWVLSYSVAAWFAWSAGTNMWRMAVGMARHQAVLDTEGVLLLVSENKQSTREEFAAWDQIAAIRHRRMGHNEFYSIVTKDNRTLVFDAFAFFRSRKLAEHISARAGLPIQELK